MSFGLTRAPIDSPSVMSSARARDSYIVFDYLDAFCQSTEQHLRLGTDQSFMVTAEGLEARAQQLDQSRATVYTVGRGMHDFSLLLGGTVDQLQQEFNKQSVLDVGCGAGRFGREIMRKAGAKVLFLDCDETILSRIPVKESQKVLGDGTALEFSDNSFAKVVSAFSALLWPTSPIDALKAFYEGLRVTEPGGTFFPIPIVTGILRHIQDRRSLDPIKSLLLRPYAQRSAGSFDPSQDTAVSVGMLKDWALLKSLFELSDEGLCEVTLSSFVGPGQKTGVTLDIYSAIVDKKRDIPEELIQRGLNRVLSLYSPEVLYPQANLQI